MDSRFEMCFAIEDEDNEILSVKHSGDLYVVWTDGRRDFVIEEHGLRGWIWTQEIDGLPTATRWHTGHIYKEDAYNDLSQWITIHPIGDDLTPKSFIVSSEYIVKPLS